MEKKKLGILGGMGSEATVLFYKKIIDNTSVNNDREHLDILIYNHASIPDRTECILCGKQDYLWDIIANDIRGMEQLGCEYFAIPCNTCHYFADRLQELTNGKFINMIEETARYAAVRGRKKVGVMATDGTVQGGMYKKAMEAQGIEVVYPSRERQEDVMSLIYEQIKRGEKGDRHQFMNVVHELRAQGCDAVILACTELSVLNVNYSLNPDFYIDAMNVVAKACIEKCGGVYCE